MRYHDIQDPRKTRKDSSKSEKVSAKKPWKMPEENVWNFHVINLGNLIMKI